MSNLYCYNITSIIFTPLTPDKEIRAVRPVSLLAPLFVSAAPALADLPRIVTDVPVTQGLVAAVAGDGAEVTVLMEGAADPHSFQMRPSQARALAEADLVVWVGPELTPWLERALDANAADVPVLTLLDATGVSLREIGDGEAEQHDHGHEGHGQDDPDLEDNAHGTDEEIKAHDDHSHDGTDPHAWLDPANTVAWTEAIANALAAAEPAGAEGFGARAGALTDDIRALEIELAQLLNPVRDEHLVFQHDAYGYLTGHFGMSRTSSIADVDGVDPGAGHLAELAEASGVKCVFGEVGQNPRLPERLARDLGAGYAILDPVGAEAAPGPGHYRALMTGLARAISECAAARG